MERINLEYTTSLLFRHDNGIFLNEPPIDNVEEIY